MRTAIAISATVCPAAGEIPIDRLGATFVDADGGDGAKIKSISDDSPLLFRLGQIIQLLVWGINLGQNDPTPGKYEWWYFSAQAGDVFHTVNGTKIHNAQELRDALDPSKVPIHAQVSFMVTTHDHGDLLYQLGLEP